MDKKIVGYKAFYPGLVNKYGKKFCVGNRYVVDDRYKKHKIHFCKNLEDTLIYLRDIDIEICGVVGYGEVINYCNSYYGVYDVYACDEIEIIKKVSRDEIINMFLNEVYSLDRIVRFVSLYKLTNEEVMMFKEVYKNCSYIVDAICYYQEGDVKVYERRIRNG